MRRQVDVWVVVVVAAATLAILFLAPLVDRVPRKRSEAANPADSFGIVAARRIWGPVCGGHVRVSAKPLGSGVLGEANFLVAATRPRDPRFFTGCVIYLNSNRTYSRTRRCATIVHEVGHLARGPQHSSNPRSIMFYKFTARNVPARCAAG